MTSELLPSASFHLKGKMTLVSKFFLSLVRLFCIYLWQYLRYHSNKCV